NASPVIADELDELFLVSVQRDAGLPQHDPRDALSLSGDELVMGGRLAGFGEDMTVMRAEEQQVHVRVVNSAQAGLPARMRLRAEVLKTDRLMPKSQDQTRQGVTLRLQAPADGA